MPKNVHEIEEVRKQGKLVNNSEIWHPMWNSSYPTGRLPKQRKSDPLT